MCVGFHGTRTVKTPTVKPQRKHSNTSVVDLVVDNSSEKEVIVVLETDNVFKAFDNMLNPEMVLHTNLEPSIPGIKRKRPANWQTIAEYYMVYRSVRGTIKFFELSYLNESIPYWTTTFGRWMKDYQANKSHLQYGREPVYGTEIDDKLANIVRDYNKKCSSSNRHDFETAIDCAVDDF